MSKYRSRQGTLQSGHGFVDYLLYLDGKAAGVFEAKKQLKDSSVRIMKADDMHKK